MTYTINKKVFDSLPDAIEYGFDLKQSFEIVSQKGETVFKLVRNPHD